LIKEDPAGNVKPDKARSTGRIDGIRRVLAPGNLWPVYCARARKVRVAELEPAYIYASTGLSRA
jgi:hypothetical protein